MPPVSISKASLLLRLVVQLHRGRPSESSYQRYRMAYRYEDSEPSQIGQREGMGRRVQGVVSGRAHVSPFTSPIFRALGKLYPIIVTEHVVLCGS